MKIDFFIPPAVDDIAFASGYLIRCKPGDDCASLFGPDSTTTMYTMLGRAFRDAHAHAKLCPNDHAVVAIARGDALNPVEAVEGASPPASADLFFMLPGEGDPNPTWGHEEFPS